MSHNDTCGVCGQSFNSDNLADCTACRRAYCYKCGVGTLCQPCFDMPEAERGRSSVPEERPSWAHASRSGGGLEVTERRVNAVVVFSPVGLLALSSVDTLNASVIPAVQHQSVVLDFSGIERMMTGGQVAILLAAKTARAAGTKLAIAAPQPVVEEVLRISRYDKLVPVYDTVDEATRAIASA